MPEDKFIIVEFSAWKSADAKTLVNDFFEAAERRTEIPPKAD
jgi:hypothetical protein